MAEKTTPRGVFVTGTDTGVGKTYVGAAIIRCLVKRGISVIPRKPVESGCRMEHGALFPADAAILYAAAGQPGTLDEVCRYRLRQPLSPARAARLESMELTINDLERTCRQGVESDSFIWVEGAGGFYSPLASDGLNADLAARVGMPVLLVAADRLGCINHVLLNVEAIQTRSLDLTAVVLNQIEPSTTPAMCNAEDLESRLPCPLFSIGHDETEASAGTRLARLATSLI